MLSWQGCLKNDDHEIIEPRLVVEAFLTSDTMSHKILLSETINIGQDSVMAISGAIVRVIDGEGAPVDFNELPGGPEGIYYSRPDFFIIPGNIYHLKIDLVEPVNGYLSYESYSTASFTQPIDSIKLKFHSNWGTQGFYEVQCYYQDPLTHEFYLCNTLIDDTLVTHKLTEKIVVEDILFNGNYAYGVACGFLDQSVPSEIIRDGDLVILQLANVEESFANFIWGVQDESGIDNPFFGNPAANVYSNINHGAIGYFACCHVTYSSVKF